MKKITIVLFALLITSCVQKQYLKSVLVKVDARGVENVKSIGIKGDFTNPRWKTEIPMTDDDNDGIFEATLSQETAVYNVEFKFVKNGEIYELIGKPNRVLQFEYKPETIVYSAKFNDMESIVIERE